MKKNRITAVLLSLCLMLQLTVGARAAGTALQLELPSELPAVGETFQVQVHLQDSPGIHALQFTLAFDDAVVDCVEIGQGEIVSGMIWATDPDAEGGAAIAAVSPHATDQDGTVSTMTFQVLKEGDPAIKLEHVLLGGRSGGGLPCTMETVSQEVPPTEDSEGVPPVQRPEDRPAEGHARQRFTDVPAEHWAYDYITRAADLGLVSGYDDGTFRPGKPVTRAQFVTMLWRMAGKPDADAKTGFADVPDDAWCAEAVSWAVGSGIVNGVTESTFAPDRLLTRQQAAVLLFRFSGSISGMETVLYELYDQQFADSADLGSWSRNAVYWAVYNGIMTGVTDSSLAAGETAGRGQIAAILLRYADRQS